MYGFAPMSEPSCHINIPEEGRFGLILGDSRAGCNKSKRRHPLICGPRGRRYSNRGCSFTCPLPKCNITMFRCWIM